jgi:glycosyltransferase domain-containing protein
MALDLSEDLLARSCTGSNMNTAPPRSRYTLLIPTFNRPAELRSLLGYLAARRFPYPVRVLDSSSGGTSAQNRETVNRAEIDVIHKVFDPAVEIHEKVTLALAEVESTYCSLCADDDVLFTNQLEEMMSVLDSDPALALAHGYYASFRAGPEFELWHTEYSAPSIVADDAMKRIVKQMSGYQAIFYGVHRTAAMRSRRGLLDRVRSLWAKELLTSSLTLIEGGAYRAPRYYMARRAGHAVSTVGWHPHHFLATEPARLLREYLEYRAVALEQLMTEALCRVRYRKEQMERVFDLAHLNYLAAMLSPNVLDYLIRQILCGESTSQQMIEQMWMTVPAQAEAGLLARLLARARRLRPAELAADGRYLWLLASLLARLRFQEKFDAWLGARSNRLTVERTTRDGRTRRYTITRAFLTQEFADGGRVTAPHLADIIAHLDDYV